MLADGFFHFGDPRLGVLDLRRESLDAFGIGMKSLRPSAQRVFEFGDACDRRGVLCFHASQGLGQFRRADPVFGDFRLDLGVRGLQRVQLIGPGPDAVQDPFPAFPGLDRPGLELLLLFLARAVGVLEAVQLPGYRVQPVPGLAGLAADDLAFSLLLREPGAAFIQS